MKRNSWWKGYRSHPVLNDQGSLQRQPVDAIGWVAQGPIWQFRRNRLRVRSDHNPQHSRGNQLPSFLLPLRLVERIEDQESRDLTHLR